MNKLFCSKCNEYKSDFSYANAFNSTKFCTFCGTALELKEYIEDQKECKHDWIAETIANAIMRM